MQGIQLKSTCDSCVASKVRCSGTQPCARCALKGFDCFYRPRKKRSRSKKLANAAAQQQQAAAVVSSTSSIGNNQLVNGQQGNQIVQSQVADAANVPLSGNIAQRAFRSDGNMIKAQARRSWAVFFMLYKNYNASCSRFWFDQQLAKIHRYLTKTNNKESLKQLNAWMESMDIDYASLNDVDSPCMVAIRKNQKLLKEIAEYKAPHFHVDGNLHVCSEVTVHPTCDSASCAAKAKEFLKEDENTSYSICYHSGMDDGDVTVQVSQKFADMFGTTGDVITKEVKEFGILPYGVDVFANIMSEDDLLALIQILVIKTSSFKCSMNSETSIIRQIPSCHVFDLKTAKSLKSIPFMIKMVHRQAINLGHGIGLDFTAVLEPLQPVPETGVQVLSDSVIMPSNYLLLGSGGSTQDTKSLSALLTPSFLSVQSPLPLIPMADDKLSIAGMDVAPFTGVGSPATLSTMSSFTHTVPSGAQSTMEFDNSFTKEEEEDDTQLADPSIADEYWLDDVLKWVRESESSSKV